ncbi:hypothetical protein EUGRSUZ_H03341 [Eucalyptus grandis]|uniref:Uncharacterized protein n=2 Tax=Eucalyptus grandis TaxID=71139 RepID=A0ACC3JXD6_EUCGR|nr:hypothetical protein EUGRSUZ_H03341 [Eucalyptus grandis]
MGVYNAHYARWEKSNRLSLIAMKRSIVKHLISDLSEDMNVRQFLEVVGERYTISNKVEAGNLLSELTNMRYDVAMGSKLKAHNIVFSKAYIVHHALNVLPAEFSQIKNVYSAQNETWSVNALITKCVTKDEKLKNEKYESAHLIANAKLKVRS